MNSDAIKEIANQLGVYVVMSSPLQMPAYWQRWRLSSRPSYS